MMMFDDYYKFSVYFKIFNWVNKQFPDVNFEESVSPNQLKSKIWMINELSKLVDKKRNLKIEVVGSWLGWPLAGMLFETFNIKKLELIDQDINCCEVAKRYSILFGQHVKITNLNYWQIDQTSDSDIIINCSSEHMFDTFADHKNRYSSDSIFVIQSNNMNDINEHVNCCENENELIEYHEIKKVLYTGSLDFVDTGRKKYKRFMVIGNI